MWAIQFAIVFISGVAMFATVCGIAIGLIMLGKAYGPPAVFISLIVFLATIGALAISHSIANEKLTKMEREEERTMNALKKDYTPAFTPTLTPAMQKRMHKYYNILYGDKNVTP
jgi:hypothetical protein